MLNLIKYILYLILSVLIIILFIEFTSRIIIHLRYSVPGRTYGIWKYDKELGADHKSNSYNTHTSLNNYGFRNKEDVFEPKPENSLRIIAIGGSTTFGYNLQDGETFTEKLEAKLRKIQGFEKT